MTTCAECTNEAVPGETVCEHCLDIEHLKNSQTRPHTWRTGPLTGTVTCENCGLLPLDDSDTFSDCPGGPR